PAPPAPGAGGGAAGGGAGAAPAGPAAGADAPYRELAAALIGQLARDADDPHATAVRAGRDWGRALAGPIALARQARPPRGPVPAAPGQPAAPVARREPVDGLFQVLAGLGFSPRVAERPATDEVTLHLHTCPFLDLAVANPDVVCGVHQGVVDGALGVLGAPATDLDLAPFAVPGACVVRFRTRRARTAEGDDPAGTEHADAEPGAGGTAR
ncbi:MAG: hypothetical protein IRZ08_15105, partial [Frankia sp.]|nr:hypothetical protein [Frankia sp.]